MEEDFRKSRGGDHASLRLLDLISNERDWILEDASGEGVLKVKATEEKDLELRLGLPRGGGGGGKEDPSAFSLGLFSKSFKTISSGVKRGFFDTIEPNGGGSERTKAGFGKELSKKNSVKAAEQHQQQSFERKPSHVDVAGARSSSQTQTRNVSAPVVGWPPIRSFRKNLANSNKPSVASPTSQFETKEKTEILEKCLFVKINMDGVPIGRKVDLKAYDSYDKISNAVEELFQGLLAAQKNPSSSDAEKNDRKRVFTGLLDGTGEYTLVYEDSEGDRMLVGDVPWEMFVLTAKRLRVLKSSDLSTVRLGAVGGKMTAGGCQAE